MTDLEKARIKMTCVIEASKLKQNSNPTLAEELAGKNIVDIAKDLVTFVFAA